MPLELVLDGQRNTHGPSTRRAHANRRKQKGLAAAPAAPPEAPVSKTPAPPAVGGCSPFCDQPGREEREKASAARPPGFKHAVVSDRSPAGGSWHG